MDRLLAGLALIVAAGCGGGGEGARDAAGGDSVHAPDASVRGTLGRVAFSEADTGALVVVDVETGARVERTFAQGAPGWISLEPSGGHIAFSLGADRNVFVADSASGEAIGVTPPTGIFVPTFWWGVGGWFTYVRQAGGPAPELRLATVAGGESSVIAQWWPAVPSVTDDSYVVSRCTSVPSSGYCPAELVFGHGLDPAASRVVTSGPWMRIVEWIEARGEVVGYEPSGETWLLVVIDVETGARRELGSYSPVLEENGFGLGLSDLSPDGAELLTYDGTDIVAVRLDGTGSRPIAEGLPARVGFTSRGDLIIERTTNVGSGDVVQYLYDLFVVRDGEVVQMVDHVRYCSWPAHVAPDGGTVAWSCEGGTKIFSLPDGALVAEHPGGDILGFTPDGTGIVATEYSEAGVELAHWPRGGASRSLGRIAYGDPSLGWPLASYSPN